MANAIGASRTKRLAPRRWLFLSLVLVFVPLQALADTPCDGFGGELPPVPNCELQEIGPYGFHGWETNGYKLWCKGSHPYYWGNIFGGEYFTVNNRCFRYSQWPPGTNFYADVLLTNWCFKWEPVEITIACSSEEPP